MAVSASSRAAKRKRSVAGILSAELECGREAAGILIAA
jgi:hypothetical protein